MKTKQEIRRENQRKEFWAIIKTMKPNFHRALELARDIDSRLLAVCASALVSFVTKESRGKKPKRKPSAWSVFAGEQMHVGKSIKEAAELWKSRR